MVVVHFGELIERYFSHFHFHLHSLSCCVCLTLFHSFHFIGNQMPLNWQFSHQFVYLIEWKWHTKRAPITRELHKIDLILLIIFLCWKIFQNNKKVRQKFFHLRVDVRMNGKELAKLLLLMTYLYVMKLFAEEKFSILH